MKQKPDLKSCTSYCNQRQVMPLMEWYIENEGLSVRAASRKVETDTNGEVTANRARNVWSSRKGKPVLNKTPEPQPNHKLSKAMKKIGLNGCTEISLEAFNLLVAAQIEESREWHEDCEEPWEGPDEWLTDGFDTVLKSGIVKSVLIKTAGNEQSPLEKSLFMLGIVGCKQIGIEAFNALQQNAHKFLNGDLLKVDMACHIIRDAGLVQDGGCSVCLNVHGVDCPFIQTKGDAEAREKWKAKHPEVYKK